MFRPDDRFPARDGTISTAPLSWEAGSALVCLFCVSVAHALHLLGHALVPTPTICYDTEEQEKYEHHHQATQSVRLSQIIPEVNEIEDDDVSDVYYDDDKRNPHGPAPTVQDTVSF